MPPPESAGEVCTVGADNPRYRCKAPVQDGWQAMPPALWGANVLYLDGLVQLPELCQGTIDDLNKDWDDLFAAQSRIGAARAAADRLKAATGWQTWKVYLAVIGGVAVGVVAGFVSGFVAGLAQ